MKKTFIIAEAGANHDRKFEQAIKLIDIAVSAGADAVKFQTYSSETLYAKNTLNFAGYENINKLIKDIELPREWQKDLKQYCDESGIEFMSTPFDEKAVDELVDVGVKRLKIAGFEATDPRIVKYAASTQLPLIITAGIGVDLVMIQKIIDWVVSENSNPDITFLHGNNAYPTPYEDICLGQIGRIKRMQYSHPIEVGISDHTEGILVPPLAVALGAKVVEKHFTISRYLTGPDHGPHAVEPNELSDMVKNIRIVEKCLKQKNSMTNSEKKFRNARRSIVALKQIKENEIFCLENITTKRPVTQKSLPADLFYDMLGNKANKTIEADCFVKIDDIKY
mgnify:CR=1 FL=1